MALDYENIILISHEDTSKDITKKGGDKITAIKPNMQEKAANKVAGMVDIVARVIADGDIRTLSFKTNEVIFGGGRLTTSTNEIALDYDEFLGVYEEANKAAVASMTKVKPTSRKKKEEKVEDVPSELIDNEEALANETKQIESEEKVEEVEDTTETEEVAEEPEKEEKAEEKPKTRVRKRREN